MKGQLRRIGMLIRMDWRNVKEVLGEDVWWVKVPLVVIGLTVIISVIVTILKWLIAEQLALDTFLNAPDPIQRLSPDQYFEARRGLFSTMAGFVGAAGFLGTLIFTWRSFRLSESGQITDRFAKAVELLGSVRALHEGVMEPNVEARMGAIYALERIARDSVRDHWQVMEVLTAYARNTSRALETRSDIQAALNVLGRRKLGPHREYGHSLDLRRAHLESYEFGAGHFEHALLDSANLDSADLAFASLDHARLKRASLNGAELFHARMEGCNLEEGSLQNAVAVGASLKNAVLRHARLNGSFLCEAQLSGVDLDLADLTDVDLRDAIGLTQNQLNSTRSYVGAKNLPAYLKPDTRGDPSP